MKIQSLTATLWAIAILTALQGCTTSSGSGVRTNPSAATSIPAADPMLDHYIAWVPRDNAQTATVAEAMTHISLVNAREQTARQLCGGKWVVNGEVTDSVGPLPATAPATAGGYPAWYYRISQRPGLHGCRNTDSQQLYYTLQEHLPVWMDIQTAGSTALGLLE